MEDKPGPGLKPGPPGRKPAHVVQPGLVSPFLGAEATSPQTVLAKQAPFITGLFMLLLSMWSSAHQRFLPYPLPMSRGPGPRFSSHSHHL